MTADSGSSSVATVGCRHHVPILDPPPARARWLTQQLKVEPLSWRHIDEDEDAGGISIIFAREINGNFCMGMRSGNCFAFRNEGNYNPAQKMNFLLHKDRRPIFTYQLINSESKSRTTKNIRIIFKYFIGIVSLDKATLCLFPGRHLGKTREFDWQPRKIFEV